MNKTKFVNRAVKAGDRQERLHKPTYSGRDNPRHNGGLPVNQAFLVRPPETWERYGRSRQDSRPIVVYELK